MLDRDSDGDNPDRNGDGLGDGEGFDDGADDTDFDGLSNAFEVERPGSDLGCDASSPPPCWRATYVSVGPKNAHNYVPGADIDPVTPGVQEGADADPLTPGVQGDTDTDPLTPGVQGDFSYYSRVNPFNPCKPVWSVICELHPRFGYYGADEDWMGWGVPGANQTYHAPGARPGDL
jgi:hypothetical protein